MAPDGREVLWARITPERLTAGERHALDDAQLCYITEASLREIAIVMIIKLLA